MICKMFTVRDNVSGLYSNPWMSPNAPAACRSFGDLLGQPEAPQSKHPYNYDLYEVGTFDDNICTFTLLEKPKLIFSGEEYTREKEHLVIAKKEA